MKRGKRDVTLCWAFLRTMARDYRTLPVNGEYPWRKVGPDYCQHLAHFLCHPGTTSTSGGVILFRSRDGARNYAALARERGRPVRVRVTVLEVPRG